MKINRFYQHSGGRLTVVGGVSKLFTAFIREYSPEKIISFANYDISNGDIYEKLGFHYERTTNPSYIWTNLKGTEKYSQEFVQRESAANVLKTSTKTDKNDIELMKETGFVRVYNSGNKVYVWESAKQ